jgi:hypothetical protein
MRDRLIHGRWSQVSAYAPWLSGGSGNLQRIRTPSPHSGPPIRHKHLVERAPIPGRPAGIGAHRRGRARCSAGVTETLSPTPAPETVRPIFSADAGARACWSPPPRRPDARPDGCSAGRAGPARYLFSGAHARAGRGCGSHPLDRARPVTCSTLVPGQVLHYNRSDGIVAGEPSAEPSRPR